MNVEQFLDEKVIGGVLAAILGLAGIIAGLTKTRKDDHAVNEIKKKSGLISSILAKVANVLLMFRRKR